MTKPKVSKTTPKPKKEEVESVSFFSLFRFATRTEKFLMIIGAIGAAVDGAAMPLNALFMGQVADSFGPGSNGETILDNARTIALRYTVAGIVSFICSYLGYACWMSIGEQQSIEIRKRYFRSLLSQEMAFYDSVNPNEFSSKITEDCFNIQQGIGEKVPTFITAMATMVSGFVIGFTKGWQLAFVMTGSIPFVMIAGAIFVFNLQRLSRIASQAYAKAGAISEEVLNMIRTVVSLGGQVKETKRYHDVLNANRGPIVKYSTYTGMSIGGIFFVMLGVQALAFYVGSFFIEDKVHINSDTVYTAGSVLAVFMSLQAASFAPTRATPSIKAFAVAKAAGARAFKIIDRKSKINPEDPKGLKPTNIVGNIQFKNVTFAYPLKQERTILDGISFDIRKNEKTALVGESGCGKTTCLQLIERFYDVESGNGSITLDGNELKDLNLKWMRENIGYVGQEPVLFATSIKENLLMAKEDATETDIWDALKKANAYDFVQGLPEKLNTFVGANGTMLSGGQKQRLAIARAILKNPKILLLDEATSALDRKNEMEIQKTLDEISEGRTTIVIAHRLSTVINADHIIVIDQGKVVEEGKHEELVALKGRYYALQHLQLQGQETEKANGEQEVKEDSTSKATSMAQSTEKQAKVTNSDTVKTQEVQIVTDNGTDKTTPKEKQKKYMSNFQVFKRLFEYNKSDVHLIFSGLIGTSVQGAVFPVMAILLSKMLEVFYLSDSPDFRSKANFLSLMFFVLSLVSFTSYSTQFSCFQLVSERLSRKIRGDVFKKYVRMPIGWFDLPEHSAGSLGSKLSTDASLLNTLTGSVFGTICQGVSSFTVGLVIAFIASWELALVALGLAPLKVLAAKVRAKFSANFIGKNDKAYQDSVNFVSEAVNNMRTVVSFGTEEKIMKNYSDKLAGPLKAAYTNGQKSGFAFGVGQMIEFGTNALIFYIGAVFIKNGVLDYQQMFQSNMGVQFAAQGVGSALQFAPDIGAAIAAALSIFKILDTKPAIDIDDPNQTVNKPIKGDVEFRNVWFKYPSREKQIFKGLNLKINASNKTALVGPSGCGKSTILALLQRFYDPDQGEILMDGINIKEYDLKYLRECFGVVSQEPMLFNGTIEYNIKYTKEDATDEEMKQVAAKANALGFIERNEFAVVEDPETAAKNGTGFKRIVGNKGSQMSGGQKQRIAIARAILKNPSFLILDEATSALDAENEKSVQESLDKIMEGKTSLIVAHRISTIRDADEIIVFNDGEILERGNYKELTEKQGVFYKLERGINLGV